jgi:hypothetical protein
MGAIIGRLSCDAEEILARTVLDRMLDTSARHPGVTRGRLLMLEFWFRNFIGGDAAAEPLDYAVLVKAA